MRNRIISLEEELRVAMLLSDVNKLDVLIADSLLFIGPTGMVATKQMDLGAHKSGIQKMTKLVPSEQQIVLHDNFAVVSVKMEIEGTYGDISINGNYRYIRTWAKAGDGFQIVAGSTTQIPLP